MKEKHVALAASAFCFMFGLSTCDTADFTSGVFAGAAAIVTFVMWLEDE